jgi:hypothetical protein
MLAFRDEHCETAHVGLRITAADIVQPDQSGRENAVYVMRLRWATDRGISSIAFF